MKCEDCSAFNRTSPKAGQCRANPPTVMVFGMEKVGVPGLRGAAQGMRPLTGVGWPEVTNDAWCRQYQQQASASATPFVFNPANMKPVGDAASVNGVEIEGS